MTRRIIAVITLCVSYAGVAHAVTLNFNDLAHGQIVEMNRYIADGVKITAVNIGSNAQGNHPDIVMGFNSNFGGTTTDPDLLRPWAAGNIVDQLGANFDMGGLIVIAENDFGGGDGVIDDPDDEGSRPAGSIFFDFVTPINEFGMALVDVEDPDPGIEPGSIIFVSGLDEVIIPFSALVARDGVSWGDNSANRISTFTLAELGLGPIDQIEVQLGGSGGIGRIKFEREVPEAGATALMALIAAVGLAGLRRNLHG